MPQTGLLLLLLLLLPRRPQDSMHAALQAARVAFAAGPRAVAADASQSAEQRTDQQAEHVGARQIAQREPLGL